MLTAECGCKNACCDGGQKKAAPARPAAAPVPVPDRSFFEQRLGGDFGGVRIAPESAMATAMRARAVTHGDRIDVAPGEWQPSTPSGRRLIAHELTHVLQQRGGVATAPGPAHEAEADAVAAAALEGRRVAGPLLGAARGAAQRTPQDGGQSGPGGTQPQRGPGTAGAGGTAGTGTATATTAPVCPAAVPIRDAALRWLAAALPLLYRYAADLAIPGGTGPDPHVAASVTTTFHTSDSFYVQVIASRLAHLEFALRTGIVTIDCAAPNDPHCGAAAAYTRSDRSYAMVMCGTGVSDDRVATVIHELAHTALPEVGIRRGRTEAGHVRDRAYDHNRLIRLLTPEEALNNADSYGMLVRLLNSPPGLDLVTAVQDAPAGCSDADRVRRAIARVERALTDTTDTLGEFSAGVNALPHPPLTAAGITDVAGVDRARLVYANAAQILQSPVPITCVTGRRCATASNLGYGRDGIATTGATTVARQREEPPTGYLCGNWIGQPEAVRDRSMLAVILLSHPGNMTGTAYTAASIDTWVDLAMALYNERTPAPTTTSAVEHMFRDLDTKDDPSVPRPVPPRRP